MNSEELEVSLRTEFESYLKNVFADMRQDISQLQEKIESELVPRENGTLPQLQNEEQGNEDDRSGE